MVRDFRQVGSKARDVALLNWRRLKKKRSNNLIRKKVGLRKRLKKEDLVKELEKTRETSLEDSLMDESTAAATA